VARSATLVDAHLVAAIRTAPPPGQFIDAGGHRLHAVCRGDGTTAVVLEAGVAASSLSWARVQPALAAFTRTCAYDRAGLAWSDAAAEPRTFTRILDDLGTVVVEAGGGSRVILVGHSFGSLVVRAFAARQPEWVAGLVLVDPPTDWLELTPQRARLLRRARQASRIGEFLARIGVVRASLSLLTGGRPGTPRAVAKTFGPTAFRTLERLVGEVRKLPPELYPAVQAHWSAPKCFRAMAEYLGVLETEGEAIAAFVPPPDIPIIVISGGHQPAAEIAAHQRLAAASPRGRHLIAGKSGHWILFDEPEVIVEAVRSLIA
jgi:pimeloyl-ACP methyl ester carboxylesterase